MCSSDLSASADGISIYSSSGPSTWTSCVIKNNHILETRTPSYTANAFYFGYLNNATISGNIVQGTVTYSVYWVGSQKSENVALSDNIWDTSAWYSAPNSYFLGEVIPVFGQELLLTDGVSAPATQTGYAQIYVDSADGDLKIKFGDGTVKTIVTD